MISNATPVIFLSKLGRLSLLQQLFKQVIIPGAVRDEVLLEGKPGYWPVKEALEQGWIKVQDPHQLLDLNLGRGETAAISLAKEQNDLLLLDDAYAIKAAKMYGLETVRTTTILIWAGRKKILTSGELIRLINKLMEEGYYIKPAEYAQLLSRLQQAL